MAIVTTYICDVSGVQGEKKDFVEVSINGTYTAPNGYQKRSSEIKKFIHKDVAIKLGIVSHDAFNPEAVKPPEITLEGQLNALLSDYIYDIVAEHLANQ